MHLLFEKQVLVDVMKDVAPLMMGGFIYPFSEFATPKDQLAKRIGYQDDSDAAKGGQGAVGRRRSGQRHADARFHGARPQPPQPFGAAIQEMLRTVNIQTNIRTVVESVWFGDAAAGNYDLCVGAIVSSLLDPSDYFKPGTGPTARNYVKGHNRHLRRGAVRHFWLDKA
jgi:hypothetical protein